MTEYHKIKHQLSRVLDFQASELVIKSIVVRKLPFQTFDKICDIYVTHDFTLEQMETGIQHIVDKLEQAVLALAEGAIIKQVEECGKRSLRPVSYLVPLELDCCHDDDALRLCPRDPQGNEEDDADDDEEDNAIATNDDSILAENQGGSNVSADAKGQEFLPDASYAESLHTSGSSRASGPANGTTAGCNLHTNATPNTISPSLPPATVVTQAQEGEERDAGRGAAPTTTRPQ